MLPISAPDRVFEEYGRITLIFVIPTPLRKRKRRKREMKAISFFWEILLTVEISQKLIFSTKKNEDQDKLTITDL